MSDSEVIKWLVGAVGGIVVAGGKIISVQSKTRQRVDALEKKEDRWEKVFDKLNDLSNDVHEMKGKINEALK